MTDRLDFEPRLGERLRARGALAARPFDAAAIAHQAIVTAGPRRRIGSLAWPARGPVIASLAQRPAAAWLIVGLLLVLALLGAVGLAGSPTPQPAPSPTASPGPAVVIPPGLSPRLTPAAVEAAVVALVETNQVGLASVPVVVTKVTLLGAGKTYPYDRDGHGFTEDALSWVVEFTGTWVICGSWCDEHPTGAMVVIDDATGDVRGDARRPPANGYLTSGDGQLVPSEDFRQRLGDNGLVWTPIAAPPAGIVTLDAILQHVDLLPADWSGPRGVPTGRPFTGPFLGRISFATPSATQAPDFPFLTPPAGSALIWWVQSLQTSSTGGQFAWTAFDAATGHAVLSNAP
jgi:hypothetical protein